MDAFDEHYERQRELNAMRGVRGALGAWFKGLARQANVVFALLIREMKTRYGRSSLGYAMAFVSPMLQKGLLILIMVVAAEKPPIGTSMVLFYWVGLSSYHMFGFVSNKVIGSLKESRKVRVLPTIMPIDYALMRAILEASTNIIITVIGLIGIYMFDTVEALPGEPLWVVQSMMLMVMLGVGVGLINSGIVVFFPTYGYIWKAVSAVLMLTSGLFRVPDSLPHAAKEYMLWNPLTHGIELFRMGFYPGYYTAFVDVQYLAYWSCSAIFLGLMTERVLRRRIMSHK